MLSSLRRGGYDVRGESWNVNSLNFVVVAGRNDLRSVSRSTTHNSELLPR